jgi:hypothetical protein
MKRHPGMQGHYKDLRLVSPNRAYFIENIVLLKAG